MTTRHRLRDRLLHHHHEDPYDPKNWPVGESPSGGFRPFPIPPTPTDSSASISGEEKKSGDHHEHSSSRSKHRSKHHRSSKHKSKHRSSSKRRKGSGTEGAGDKFVIDPEFETETEAKRDREREEEGVERRRRRASVATTKRDSLKPSEYVGSSGEDEVSAEESGGVALRDSRARPQPTTVMTTPTIIHTPATPLPGDAPELRMKKRRSTTPLVLPDPNVAPRSVNPIPPHALGGHSRSISYPENTYTINMPDVPESPNRASALIRQRLSSPPYPMTPPLVMGSDYISASPPSSTAPVHRIPTVLRPGGKSHPQSQSPHEPPPGVVEIGEGRELQRTDSKRELLRRSRSKTTPVSSSSALVNSNIQGNSNDPQSPRQPPPRSPTSPTPSSYRDSVLSTFSNLSRSLSKSLSSPAAKRPAHTLSQRTENAFSILKGFDTVFLVDDSPSMLYESRWHDTYQALSTISEIATKYDSDGIDILFLNSPEQDTRGVTTPEQVNEIFSRVKPFPGGSTPLGARLDEILREYLDRYRRARKQIASHPSSSPSPSSSEGGGVPLPPPPRLSTLIKPLNIVVITDGDATDDPEQVIVSAARELEKLHAPLTQVGIQMFQVGGDPEAAEFLRGLDDDLVEVYGIRDMVDTTPYRGGNDGSDGEGNLTGEEILKVLVGAINRRVDRRENYRPGREREEVSKAA